MQFPFDKHTFFKLQKISEMQQNPDLKCYTVQKLVPRSVATPASFFFGGGARENFRGKKWNNVWEAHTKLYFTFSMLKLSNLSNFFKHICHYFGRKLGGGRQENIFRENAPMPAPPPRGTATDLDTYMYQSLSFWNYAKNILQVIQLVGDQVVKKLAGMECSVI